MTDKTKTAAKDTPESATKSAHDKLVARVRKVEARVEQIAGIIGSHFGIDTSAPDETDED